MLTYVYMNRLDKFDGSDIASICVSEGVLMLLLHVCVFILLCKYTDISSISACLKGLFEEAFVIYKKFDDKKAAIMVLLGEFEQRKACELDRAKDFATSSNLDEVCCTLPCVCVCVCVCV